MQTSTRFFFLMTFLFITTVNATFSAALKHNKVLKPEEAFQVEAVKNATAIETKIKLGEKIYIYEESVKYSIQGEKNFELDLNKPKAHAYDGDMVYDKVLHIAIPLEEIESKVGGEYKLTMAFQGCSAAGICYEPIEKQFTFVSNKKVERSLVSKLSALVESSNSKDIASALANESALFIVALFFIAGVLMALTPCILPMVPILSSIILQQAKKEGEVKRSTAFAISLVYVVAMAVTYALIGVVAGLLDFDIQSNMNNPWVIVPVALIFIALAASLFGYFELALPASLQAKLTKVSDNAQGNGYVGTAIMGSLSALIVGACTAPIISGAILFIVFTGKALLGGIALFFMGLGAGLPLLLVGLGASKFVPKPGGWMSMVSKFFGLLMLLIAIFLLSRLFADVGDRGYSIEKLERQLQETTKPVIVDIYKVGCAACVELEEITFVDPKVAQRLKDFTMIRIDITDYTPQDKALLKKYNIFGTPNILFFDGNDTYLPEKTVTGFVPPKAFLGHIKGIQ
jgi:thiol:disulfide interchange protein DsbD